MTKLSCFTNPHGLTWLAQSSGQKFNSVSEGCACVCSRFVSFNLVGNPQAKKKMSSLTMPLSKTAKFAASLKEILIANVALAIYVSPVRMPKLITRCESGK